VEANLNAEPNAPGKASKSSMGRRALIHHHEKDLCAPWAGQSNFAAHHVICVLEESNERFFFICIIKQGICVYASLVIKRKAHMHSSIFFLCSVG
jgi:hypothetical protein